MFLMYLYVFCIFCIVFIEFLLPTFLKDKNLERTEIKNFKHYRIETEYYKNDVKKELIYKKDSFLLIKKINYCKEIIFLIQEYNLITEKEIKRIFYDESDGKKRTHIHEYDPETGELIKETFGKPDEKPYIEEYDKDARKQI